MAGEKPSSIFVWFQCCDSALIGKIRINKYPDLVSTRCRIHIEFKNIHSGERIQEVSDSQANSPDTRGRKAYPERKSFGFKNVRMRVDGALADWAYDPPLLHIGEFKKRQRLRQGQRQKAVILLVKRTKMIVLHAFLNISLAYSSKLLRELTKFKILTTTWTKCSESFSLSLYFKSVRTSPVIGHFANIAECKQD